MRNIITGLIFASSALLVNSAHAEVTRLGIRFAGGCISSNADGACTIDTVAFGEDFELAPGIQLYSAPTRDGHFLRISSFKRPLDQDGRARSRFKNIPQACYQMRMEKTEDQRELVSNTLCEGDANALSGKPTNSKK